MASDKEQRLTMEVQKRLARKSVPRAMGTPAWAMAMAGGGWWRSNNVVVGRRTAAVRELVRAATPAGDISSR